jgi:hypothetical protein
MVTFLNLTIKSMEQCPFLCLLRFAFNTFCASEPMKELTCSELRRWHGRVVVGILLAGSAAFALVFWVTVWGTFR